MIFDKTMRVEPSSFDSAEAVTLMSADIDRIAMSMSLVHEIYASVLETGVGIWLMYTFIGLAMVVPMFWILVCLLLGLPVAKAAADAQVPWLEAIEDRLSSTVKAIGSIRGIKMTGHGNSVSGKILDLRQAEIRASLRHRLLNIFVLGISESPLPWGTCLLGLANVVQPSLRHTSHRFWRSCLMFSSDRCAAGHH